MPRDRDPELEAALEELRADLARERAEREELLRELRAAAPNPNRRVERRAETRRLIEKGHSNDPAARRRKRRRGTGGKKR